MSKISSPPSPPSPSPSPSPSPPSSQSRPRVLLLMSDFSLSGAPIMAQRLMESLAPSIELRTIALDGGPLRANFARWGQTTVLSQFALLPVSLAQSLEQSIGGARGLVLRLRGRAQWPLSRWRPDAILFNSCASLPLARYLRLPTARRLLYVHETGRLLDQYRDANRKVFDAGFDGYFAVSAHVRAALEARGVAPERIELTPNFLPSPLLARLDKLRQEQPPETARPWLIGGAGTLSWTKGPQLWLLMAAELSRLMGHENVRFEWVGGRDTATDKQFVWMAHQLGLSNVALIPATPDPFPHYAKFDVFALSSWEDACPLVVLENMALGNLVACFAPSGGAPEIVGDAGIVIKEFDPVSMASQIAGFLANQARRAATKQRALQRARDFAAPDGAARMLKQIRELASKSSA